MALAPIPLAAQSLTPAGNPSAFVAAEAGLGAAIRSKGARDGLEANADPAGTVIAGSRATVRDWLKANDPAPLVAPHRVDFAWASCDGTAGVSAGAWGGDAGGWFATVWKRQKKKGDYRWVVADAAPLATPIPAPDWVTGKVAQCPRRPPRPDDDDGKPKPVPQSPAERPLPAPVPAADAGSDSRDGRSDDGSLVWRTMTTPHGRALRVWLYQDGAMQLMLSRDVS